jgi:hypothetical protein
MTLASAANAVAVNWYGSGGTSSNGNNIQVSLFRGNNAVTTQLGYNQAIGESGPAVQLYVPVSGAYLDMPYAGATTSAAYTVGIVSPGGTSVTFPGAFGGGTGNGMGGGMILQEIMG